MAEFEREKEKPEQKPEPGDQSKLLEELLEQLKPPQPRTDGATVEVPDGNGKTRKIPLNEGESAEKLDTGDTLVVGDSGDLLLMPNGSKLAFLTDGGELQERLFIEDKDGKEVEIKYSCTLTGMPPTDVFNLSDGSQVKVNSGVAELTTKEGHKVYLDELGVFAVMRGDKKHLVREPELAPEEWDIAVKPKKGLIL